MQHAHTHSARTLEVLRPEDPISAFVSLQGDAAVLAVAGELDGASASAFKSAISAAQIGGSRALVIDLSDVTFVGSVGISVLLEARARVGEVDRFAIVAGGPVVGRTIQILGLAESLAVHSTVSEALDGVMTGAAQRPIID